MEQNEAFLSAGVVVVLVTFLFGFCIEKKLFNSYYSGVFLSVGVGGWFVNTIHFFSSEAIVSRRSGEIVTIYDTLIFSLVFFVVCCWLSTLMERIYNRKNNN